MLGGNLQLLLGLVFLMGVSCGRAPDQFKPISGDKLYGEWIQSEQSHVLLRRGRQPDGSNLTDAEVDAHKFHDTTTWKIERNTITFTRRCAVPTLVKLTESAVSSPMVVANSEISVEEKNLPNKPGTLAIFGHSLDCGIHVRILGPITYTLKTDDLLTVKLNGGWQTLRRAKK